MLELIERKILWKHFLLNKKSKFSKCCSSEINRGITQLQIREAGYCQRSCLGHPVLTSADVFCRTSQTSYFGVSLQALKS